MAECSDSSIVNDHHAINVEFGKKLARTFYGSGVEVIPIVVSSEVADAFHAEWSRISSQTKKRHKITQ